jgi:hypothetical protein
VIRAQLRMTLTDLRGEHEPASWVVPTPAVGTVNSWGERQYRVMKALVDAAATVQSWRGPEHDNDDAAAVFARDVVHKGYEYLVSLYSYGADLAFVMTMEPTNE